MCVCLTCPKITKSVRNIYSLNPAEDLDILEALYRNIIVALVITYCGAQAAANCVILTHLEWRDDR